MTVCDSGHSLGARFSCRIIIHIMMQRLVKMVMSDLLEHNGQLGMGDALNSAIMESGAQSVMTCGITQMLALFADSLATLKLVDQCLKHQQILFITLS